MPQGQTVVHPIKNVCVSADVLTVWSQYPGAAEVKRLRARSQVTLDAATVRKHSDRPTSSFVKQVKQIHLKCVSLCPTGIERENYLLYILKTAAAEPQRQDLLVHILSTYFWP